MKIDALNALYEEIKEEALRDYFTFLRFPSISSSLHHLNDLKACAEWVERYLREGGFNTEIWENNSHPAVFASYEVDPAKPTLLFYGHYDVQPVEPLKEWRAPPFEPTVKGGSVYARGAQDNKGQCFYTMLAAKTLLQKTGTLPLNVKFLIEGEEEVGSPSLPALLKKNRKKIQADHLAIVDVGFHSVDRPGVTVGIRGIATMEVFVQGSNGDLHSGSHGGVAYNPIHALVFLLAKLRDGRGRIAVPGFYDGISPLSDKEKKAISLSFDEKEYEALFGAPPTGGEIDFPLAERNVLRPTLEINGIVGGYTEPGFKTVIPAKASAKISCRLVPGQEPETTVRKVASFLEEHAPPGICVDVAIHPGGGLPFRVNPDSPLVRAFQKTYEELYNRPCEIIMEGASIPIASDLARESGAETVLVGLALPDDQIHAPNEKFGLDRVKMGFMSIAKVLHRL